MLRRRLLISVLVLLPFTISLAFGCTSDGGGGGSTLLEGDPDSPASGAVRDLDSGDRVSEGEITNDENGARTVRTKVEIGFSADATVGNVNTLLESVGGLITSMLEGVNLIVVRIPDPGSLDGLGAVVAQLEGDSTVESVRKLVIREPRELPPNYTAGTGDIDHHLAVRAHAAWNAKAALEDSFADPPLLIVEDKFGDGPPNTDFDVKITPAEFGIGNANPHGYHVLGIIAGKHGGSSDRGLVTGIYPGTLDLSAVDLNAALVLDDATAENLIVIRAKISNRNVVVNSSLGDTGVTANAVSYLEPKARNWIQKVRGSVLYETGTTGPASLENRFLHLVAAGNIGQGHPTEESAYDGPYQFARLFWLLETKGGVSLDNLNNTLIIENRENSSSQPYAPGCLSLGQGGSKHPGDLSAIGHLVLSFTGSSSGVLEESGTSMASPQVAGLAAYVWALAPGLTPQGLLSLLQRTARDGPGCPGTAAQPVIDAYNAVLAVDDASALADGDPAEAAVRLAILDIVGSSKATLGGNKQFNEIDVERFVDEITGAPSTPDYSRFDLNGDGFTGGKNAEKFNLDIDAALKHGKVTQDIKDETVNFDENSVTDLKVLCYYAYSPLFTGDDKKRDELMEPWLDDCKESLIAFTRTPWDTYNTDIYTMTAEGEEPTPLTNWEGQFKGAYGLASSRDGSELAVSLPLQAGLYLYADLFRVGADGGGPVNITRTSDQREDRPAWHPSGNQLAYTTSNGIYTISRDGSGRAPLVLSDAEVGDLDHATFSPDGTTVVYMAREVGKPHHVYSRHIPSGLTRDLGEGWSPALSSDGTKIAFVGGENRQELWVMSSEGSAKRSLHTFAGEHDYFIRTIAWAPGDGKLALSVEWTSSPGSAPYDHDIYVINADGSDFKNLTSTVDVFEQYPAWLPATAQDQP